MPTKMMTPPDELSRLQRWMQERIMHPDGVLGHSPDFLPGAIESVIHPSSAQTSRERLEIYAHAYFARLLECMRDEFPMTRRAVGDEAFDELATAYLCVHPSRSYTLGDLGRGLGDFLASTRPAGTDEGDVLGIVSELARLEWNFAEVFDGPGAEDRPRLSHAALAALAPADLADVRLEVAPDLRVVAFAFPVHTYYRALRRGQESVPPAAAKTWLALSRRDYVVRYDPLSETQAAILSAIVCGETLGSAISSGLRAASESVDELRRALEAWFFKWTADGYFLGVTES